MRRKFPLFWIAQLIALVIVGVVSLFAPQATLQLQRGEQCPVEVRKPVDDLNDWVLQIKSIPAPSDLVQEFFQHHKEVAHPDLEIWTPRDKATAHHIESIKGTKWDSPAVRNAAWEAFEDWLLSCSPPPDDASDVRKWLKEIDQVPAPSAELVDWVINLEEAQMPKLELRRMMLEAKQTLPSRWHIASDQQRQTGVCIIAAALFTFFGMISPAIRRPLARIFVLIALFWMLAVLKSSLGPKAWDFGQGLHTMGLIFGIVMAVAATRSAPGLTGGWTVWLVLTGWSLTIAVLAIAQPDPDASVASRYSIGISTTVMSMMMIANGWYWLIGKSEDPAQDDAGIAQSRPPQLWTLWLIQFIVFAIAGGVALWMPEEMLQLCLGEQSHHLVVDVGQDATRVLGAWLLALSLFSFFALGAAQDWLWRIIAWIFVAVFAVMGVFGLWNTAVSGAYALWQLLFTAMALLFGMGNFWIERTRDSTSEETVENSREGWTTELLAALSFARAALSGKRPMFRHGVVLTGRFHSTPDEDVPEHEYFAADRSMSVVARFANRTQDDDACMDIRGCALSFLPDDDRNDAVPFDLLMATGAYAAARSYDDVKNLSPKCDLKKGIVKNRILREGLAAGMRRAPESFALLSYHQQIVLEWLKPSASHCLVRFRLVPTGKTSPEQQGLPDQQDLGELWQHERRSDETRQTDYLRQELVYRVARCAQSKAEGKDPDKDDIVRFELQAQFHQPEVNDSLDWYDASLEWSACEWLSLGILELDAPMPETHVDGVSFNPFHIPRSLRLPRPASQTAFDDPRMLGRLQFGVIYVLGRLRRRGLLAMARNGA